MSKRNLRSKQSPLGDDAEKLYQKRIRDLESVNETLKHDVEELRSKMADVSISSSIGTLLSSRESSQKSIATKQKGMSSRSKSNLQSMCSTKKHKTESSVKQIDGEVQKLKAQKVKLQCKIKLDSMQFRLLKASLEKEALQLKKELRKRDFEKNVLLALNRRQKLILQLKNTQALTTLKRLKLLPQSKKPNSNKNKGPPKATDSKIQDSSIEVGLLMVKLNKIHSSYERQMKEIAEEVKKFSIEADDLKTEFEREQNSWSASCDNQINNTPIDSELKELKEEFNKLSTMVSQMEMTKSQLSETDKPQDKPSENSVSSKIPNDETNLESSQAKNSEETLCEPAENSVTTNNTNDQSNLKPSEETLCKPVESSVSSKITSDQSKAESSEPKTCEETVCKREKSKAEVCCSCTKKSSCKTKNCECRANGNGCGDSCGCLASKCSNREEIVKPDKAAEPVDAGKKKPAGISPDDDKDAKKQPLRDVGNMREAGKVGNVKKVRKPVAKEVTKSTK